MRVFRDHQVLASFAGGRPQVLADGGLDVVVDDLVVEHYDAGAWHGAGEMLCAYLVPSPACPTCNRPGVPTPKPRTAPGQVRRTVAS